MIEFDNSGYPVKTATGVRCGNHHPKDQVRHVNVQAVHLCFARTWDEQAQMEAEIHAEGAWLRQAENAGYWETGAERAWEDARGVVQFEDAYRAACPELFQCDGCGTPDSQVCPDACPTRKAEEMQEAYANSY